jgi:hypothetical protein
MESALKVQNKINELNAMSGGVPQWTAVQGNFAATGFTYQPGGGGVFNPNYGYIVKIFTNSVTGEVKMFNFMNFLQ